MTDNEVNNKIINTVLTLINMMDESQKLFIKENIRFAGEDWPIGYKKVILQSDLNWSKIRGAYAKEYGWTYYTDGNGGLYKYIPEIEVVPRHLKEVKSSDINKVKVKKMRY